MSTSVGVAPPASPTAVTADLRANQAGEGRAFCSCQGVVALSLDLALRAFAQRHLATEWSPLQRINAWLPRAHHSRLPLLWHAAGWFIGTQPALLGRKPTLVRGKPPSNSSSCTLRSRAST